MKIAVIGTGYVGLVTGTCLAESGNDVICVDIDADKIRRLGAGEIPIYEPGLEELVRRNVAADRLRFTTDLPAAASATAQLVFLAVGTPSSDDGAADLSNVWAVVDAAGSARQRRNDRDHQEHGPGRHQRQDSGPHHRAPRQALPRGQQSRVSSRKGRRSTTS